jgi:hypothetical protein
MTNISFYLLKRQKILADAERVKKDAAELLDEAHKDQELAAQQAA